MEAREIMTLLTEALPGSRIEIEDLRGDGNHYAVLVESASFKNLPLIDQHRMVFAALQGRVGGILRGITLTTLVPEGEG